jgi:hypothetical protein
MGFGGQSRGLIQASKTAGWDPTVIPARGGKPAQSIAPFDVDPNIANGQKYVGEIPGGTPLAWPDGYDVNTGAGIAAPTFATPDTTYDSGVKRRSTFTRNANPVPCKPGA